jgi:hypothetical protein
VSITLSAILLGAPRFTEAVDNGLIGGVKKEDLDPKTFFFEAGEYPSVFFDKSGFSEIHDHCDPRDLLGRIGLYLQKLWQEDHRQVIDAEKADVFKGPKGGAFTGTGQSRNDCHSHLLLHCLFP